MKRCNTSAFNSGESSEKKKKTAKGHNTNSDSRTPSQSSSVLQNQTLLQRRQLEDEIALLQSGRLSGFDASVPSNLAQYLNSGSSSYQALNNIQQLQRLINANPTSFEQGTIDQRISSSIHDIQRLRLQMLISSQRSCDQYIQGRQDFLSTTGLVGSNVDLLSNGTNISRSNMSSNRNMPMMGLNMRSNPVHSSMILQNQQIQRNYVPQAILPDETALRRYDLGLDPTMMNPQESLQRSISSIHHQGSNAINQRGVLTSSLPMCLARPEDEYKLSDIQNLLRNQIEAFQATQDDCTTHTRGRNKPVSIGQVGIRCRHCAHVPVLRRQKGSTYFPSSIAGIYQAAQNMSTAHIQSGRCHSMPEYIKQQFKHLMEIKQTNGVPGAGRPYWTRSASQMGLFDSENGIRYRAAPL